MRKAQWNINTPHQTTFLTGFDPRTKSYEVTMRTGNLRFITDIKFLSPVIPRWPCMRDLACSLHIATCLVYHICSPQSFIYTDEPHKRTRPRYHLD